MDEVRFPLFFVGRISCVPDRNRRLRGEIRSKKIHNVLNWFLFISVDYATDELISKTIRQ